jgi:hypothetical protein
LRPGILLAKAYQVPCYNPPGRNKPKSDRATFYSGIHMSHSVKITTPIPSPEEIASDLGITGNRLDGLLELVDGRKQSAGHLGSVPPHFSRVKKAAKKASAKRTSGKHGFSTLNPNEFS